MLHARFLYAMLLLNNSYLILI